MEKLEDRPLATFPYKSAAETRDKHINSRWTTAEYRLVVDAAKEAGKTPATFVREVVLKALKK